MIMYGPHYLLRIALEGDITADALQFLLRRLYRTISDRINNLDYLCIFLHPSNNFIDIQNHEQKAKEERLPLFGLRL